MEIGGLQKFSLLDYPGKVAAIIFTQGCNFHCHYCYNPMLVWPNRLGKVRYLSPEAAEPEATSGEIAPGERPKDHPLSEGDLFVFLKKREGQLDAVVITGGEPTLQRDLPEFMARVKKLGYLIKLDTNGTNPAMLKKIIQAGLADYIAMDLKTGPDNYEKACGVKFPLDKIKKSIEIIKESNVQHEWRTTVVPGIVEKEDVEQLGKLIAGKETWYLQEFKTETLLLNPDFQKKAAYSPVEMAKLKKIALKYVTRCEIR